MAGASSMMKRMKPEEHQGSTGYVQTNLVSNLANGVNPPAKVVDPDLVNPWGVAFFPAGPFWISDNGTGVSTLYDGMGNSISQAIGLTVTIPADGDSNAGAPGPDGIVWNGNPLAFEVGNPPAPALFIFATEDGTIAAWQAGLGNNAQIVVPNSNLTTGPVYKGLALGNNSRGLFLYATDFRDAKIIVWNSSFGFDSELSAKFADSQLPQGFAPFGIQNVNGQLWVTYAKQDGPRHDPVAGEGTGVVDVFDTDGDLLRRFASNGVLNAPWAVVMAPNSFGEFSNDILIGNFGDGKISAWSPKSGRFMGWMRDTHGRTLTLGSLWALVFGGGLSANPQTLYFTTGLKNETNGLFGTLSPE
ncbi:MAG: TIGR03118 family protein [Candidatus Binataceae bacterium]